MSTANSSSFAAALALVIISAQVSAQSAGGMSTDRSSATGTPYTVGRGRVQIEVDLFSRSVSDQGRLAEYVWSVGATTAKLGVTRNADLEVSYSPYTEVLLTDPGVCVLSRTRGRGDVTIGGRVGIWGHSGRQSAFAVAPYITLPNGEEGVGGGAVTGGVALPLALNLGNGFTAVVTTSIEAGGASSRESEGVRISHSASVGRQVFGRVSGYAAVMGNHGSQPGSGMVAGASGGVTVAVTNNLQLNGGMRAGMSGSSERSAAYLGFAVRR